MEGLEKIFVDGIGRLKAAVRDDRAAFESEAQQAEQFVKTLRANITVLDARLKETEETAHRKDLAIQKMEETFGAEIRDLQSAVKRKEEDLESRNSEVSDLKSKIDALVAQATQLESAGREVKEEAAGEAQRAAQVIEGLRANVAALETKLRETEETAHRKDLAIQKMEETFGAEMRDLQSAVKQKEEDLESLNSEVNDLKSTIDVLVEQATQLESAGRQAKEEAAGEAQRAEQVIEGLRTKIAALEAQLTKTGQLVAGTDWTIKGLDQDRDRHAIDLNAELKPQTNGINETSSFFSQADALAQDIDAVAAGRQLKTGEEEPAPSDVQAAGAASIQMDAARETVPQDAFDRMIAEFSKLTNVIGSIASLIVRDHVRALGESMEEFPQTRLTELLESLSREVSDDKLKADFRERFRKV
jgi:chromosome segregation ATPase